MPMLGIHIPGFSVVGQGLEDAKDIAEDRCLRELQSWDLILSKSCLEASKSSKLSELNAFASSLELLTTSY